MPTKEAVWIAYDLGLDGDYENLFHWLDVHEAKECGPNLAFFLHEYGDELPMQLLGDMQKSIEIRPKDRIYAVWARSGQAIGLFLTGGRKQSPWAGYAVKETGTVEDKA